jgi:hypothetical protein
MNALKMLLLLLMRVPGCHPSRGGSTWTSSPFKTWRRQIKPASGVWAVLESHFMLKHGHCQTAPANIMGGNRWQHTALDHQNWYEWRRNDVFSRLREVRHCSWLQRFSWLNQKSNRRADFLARHSGTRRSVQSHEGRDSVEQDTLKKNLI